MSDKSYLDYDWDEFRKQMAEVTANLKKMNEAANYMRWQHEMDEAFQEFEKEMNEAANGWLASWCG